jgi:hypothetical protein
MIHEAKDVNPFKQRLIHRGRTLDWDRTLSDYGIREGDTIQVVWTSTGA